MTDLMYTAGPDRFVDPYGALAAVDAARARSSSGPGPSSFFSCPAAVGRDFRRDPIRGAGGDKLRAIIGTAIHSALEHALDGVGEQELTVEYRGVYGHTDWLPPPPRDDLVVDWKSTTLKKLEAIRQYGISLTYRAQGSFYAIAVGRPRVALVFIPVDGGAADILIVEFDADRALVDQAVDWLQGIKAEAAAGRVPLPAPLWAANRRAVEICAQHCRHYASDADPTGARRDGCPGPTPATVAVARPAGPFRVV